MAELFPVYVRNGSGSQILAVCSQLANARALRDKVNATYPSSAGDAAWTDNGVLFNPSHAAALETLASWPGWDTPESA